MTKSGSVYRDKGWTQSIEGYIREARQLTLCILRNRRLMKRPYSWAVHLNINVVLPPKEIHSVWTKATRNFRRHGLAVLWVREVNRFNKVHYHLIVKNNLPKGELDRIIELSMPNRGNVKWRKKIERIDNEWRFCHYITKARIQGRVKGKLVPDMHMRKRRLFRPRLGIKKYGTVGAFWENGQSKQKLWSEIRATEQKISDGLADPDVSMLVEHVYEMIGQSVPKRRIQRNFGLWSETAVVQDWIESLLTAKEGCSTSS